MVQKKKQLCVQKCYHSRNVPMDSNINTKGRHQICNVKDSVANTKCKGDGAAYVGCSLVPVTDTSTEVCVCVCGGGECQGS